MQIHAHSLKNTEAPEKTEKITPQMKWWSYSSLSLWEYPIMEITLSWQYVNTGWVSVP